MPKVLFRFIACFWLLGRIVIGAGEEGVLFLHLERDWAGVRLLEAEVRDGRLKAQEVGRGNRFEVRDADGRMIHEGVWEDPISERLGFPDPVEDGLVRNIRLTHERREFFLRIPASEARSIRFYEEISGPERIAEIFGGSLISEIELPPEVEHREKEMMRAFSSGTKLSTLVSNGPPELRVNVVVLAEGFTAEQEFSFTNKAKAVFAQMMNVSPYREYSNHFNAFAIFVPSAQPGSDHPAQGTYRDTYFNSSYGVGALERLITIPPNNWNSNFADGRGKVFALLAELMPQYDIPLLLVNDTEYGGSGGVPAIASINQLSAELALHEIGHSFAGLADEYEDDLSGYPDVEAANTTKERQREFVKWRRWIAPETPVPTPENRPYLDVVGLFEGAYFHSTGWYRPKFDCRMRNLSVPFCEVCRETHLLRIYSLVDPIPTSSPVENNLTIPAGTELELRVESVEPAIGALSYTWTVDGVTNSAVTGRTFTASRATLGTGTQLVRVNVIDQTAFVRNDPLGKLMESRSWLLQVAAPTVTSSNPTITTEGVLIEFNSDVATGMVLEFTENFENWIEVAREVSATELRYLVTENPDHATGFYRLRVLP